MNSKNCFDVFLCILKPPINIEWKNFPANRWDQLNGSALPSHQLSKEACLLIGKKKVKIQRCATVSAARVQDTSLYSHTSSSSTSPHMLSLDFTASHLQFFLSYSWLLQSPRHLLLQTRQFSPPTFTVKLIGSKLKSNSSSYYITVMLRYSSAHYPCYTRNCVISCYLRIQDSSMFLFLVV